MTVDSFNQLFTQLARDVYSAEKQHTKALPKLAKQAGHPRLQRAFEEHLEETKDQIGRLEQIFEILGERPRGEKCEGAQGLIMEAQEMMEAVEDEVLRDAAMIASAQAMEHYEIARYGTLLAWAETMGNRDIARLLYQSLKEEERADTMLNRLAEDEVNEEAVEIDGTQVERRQTERRQPGRGRQRSTKKKAGEKQARGRDRQAPKRAKSGNGREQEQQSES